MSIQQKELPVIQILPDHVANQIAAGEVIERPAAVVKELLENSLDAGATRIEVEFRNGGKSYIRVEDNGCGMTAEQALTSLERHATSKLRNAEDLHTITSLGFRGEALPSIASVSRFTLKTRPAGSEHGSEILINGGQFMHQRECGMAQGTRMEVANLFNSVPARRKFLKTEATEAAHIIQLVRLHAVARPEVAFELIENGRTVFQTPVCPSMRDRITEIWGRSIGKELMPIESLDGIYNLKLSGMIGKPGASRPNRRDITTLVNGRPVDSRALNFALTEAYHTYIPKGKYPIAFLFIEIDPAAIDVNIHPAKRELRFRHEAQVRQCVIRSVQATLEKHSQPDWIQAPAQDTAARTAAELIEEKQKTPLPRPVITPPRPATSRTETFAPQPLQNEVVEAQESKPVSIDFNPPPSELKIQPEAEPKAEAKEPPTEIHFDWRLIGRLKGQLALFETEMGLIVLSLRAAHQRIHFERIETHFKQGSTARQELLVPIPLEFEPVASAVLEEHLDFLNEQGFEIEPFGRHFFRLQAYPDWLPEKEAEAFVRDLVLEIREKGIDPQKKDLAYEHLARSAATRAVRLSDHLHDADILALARDLLRCKQPLTCPQGRATYFELSQNELSKRLGK